MISFLFHNAAQSVVFWVLPALSECSSAMDFWVAVLILLQQFSILVIREFGVGCFLYLMSNAMPHENSPDTIHGLSLFVLILSEGSWFILFCSCSSFLSNCCACPHLSLWGGQPISENICLSPCSHMRGYFRKQRDALSYRVFKWTSLFSAVPGTQYPCTSRRWSQVSKAIALTW